MFKTFLKSVMMCFMLIMRTRPLPYNESGLRFSGVMNSNKSSHNENINGNDSESDNDNVNESDFCNE